MWFPGKIIAKAVTPGSYIVRNNTGSIIRRNISYLKNFNHISENLVNYLINGHKKEGLFDEIS